MNRIVVAAILLAVFVCCSVPSYAASKKVYVRSFSTGEGVSETGVGQEIKDYMSEVFVSQLSLITDDEIKEYLSNAELSNTVSSNQENISAQLLKSIDVDYLVYGKIYKENDEYVIDATMLELDGTGTKKKNFGDIRFSKSIYLDRSSRALARFLLGDRQKIMKHSIFGPSDPREKSTKEVAELEEDMREIDADYAAGVDSIHNASSRRDELLVNSPLLRLGVGGLGTIRINNGRLSKIYGGGQGAIADLFFYRYKDPVGDGIDLYIRGIGKRYTMKSSAPDSAFVDAENSKYYVGNFSGTPDSGAKMYQYGGDLGMRFVGTRYFLKEAWSFYLCGAIRYLRTDEQYKVSGEKFSKKFYNWGAVGGLGMEVSLFTHLGVFAEADYAYSPEGRSSVNVSGFEAVCGVTLRTNHWF